MTDRIFVCRKCRYAMRESVFMKRSPKSDSDLGRLEGCKAGKAHHFVSLKQGTQAWGTANKALGDLEEGNLEEVKKETPPSSSPSPGDSRDPEPDGSPREP